MQFLQNTMRTSAAKTSPKVGVVERLLGLLRRVSGERQSATKHLHLLETLSLGGKRQLLLVSCGGEHFLVGGGLESVETIVCVHSNRYQSVAAKKLDGSCL